MPPLLSVRRVNNARDYEGAVAGFRRARKDRLTRQARAGFVFAIDIDHGQDAVGRFDISRVQLLEPRKVLDNLIQMAGKTLLFLFGKSKPREDRDI